MMRVVAELNDQLASDADLLAEYVRSQSDTAFARIVARHSGAVHRLAVRHTGNHAAAEDVTQATFLVLARRAKSASRACRRRGDVFPWLAKVCKFVASNWRRSEARRRKHEGRVLPSDPTDLSRPVELAELVTVALRDLRRRDRRLVELRHLDGLPWSEVAERAKTTPDAARKATSVALDKLRAALHRRGITVAPSALLTTLAYLSTPTQAAAPTAAAFTLATGVIAMMKLKTTAVVFTLATTALIGAGIATSDAALSNFQSAGQGSTAESRNKQAEPEIGSDDPQLTSPNASNFAVLELSGDLELQITKIEEIYTVIDKKHIVLRSWAGDGSLLVDNLDQVEGEELLSRYVHVRVLTRDAPGGENQLAESSFTDFAPAVYYGKYSRAEVYTPYGDIRAMNTIVIVPNSAGNISTLEFAVGYGSWETIAAMQPVMQSGATADVEWHFLPVEIDEYTSTVACFSTPINAPHRLMLQKSNGELVGPETCQAIGKRVGGTVVATFRSKPSDDDTFVLQRRSDKMLVRIDAPLYPRIDVSATLRKVELDAPLEFPAWSGFSTGIGRARMEVNTQ